MDQRTRTEYETKCQELRADLKRWETSWAKDNGGRKPGRDDIKRNPDIAQKYKAYQKSRDVLDGKAPLPTTKQQSPPPRKRKPQDADDVNTYSRAPASDGLTPSKRSRHVETPSKGRLHSQHLEETPTISRKLFSPTAVTSVGPTPQRDGRVLGLFDLLEKDEESRARLQQQQQQQTPSSRGKKTMTTTTTTAATTPSKNRPQFDSDSVTTPRMGRRTPMSASKRQYLNTFMSPLKSRQPNNSHSLNTAAAEEEEPMGSRTPSSFMTTTPSKLHFETPQFLKRHSNMLPLHDDANLATVDENGEMLEPPTAPVPLRLPRKPLGRGLSEIVASLRKVEDDRADADLEALREMEMDREASTPSTSVAASHPTMTSSRGRPPPPPAAASTAFDHEAEAAMAAEAEAQEQDARKQGTAGDMPSTYKKKGQKRTTRKVNIRPMWIKRPDQLPVGDGASDDDESMSKTQLPDGNDDDDYNDNHVSDGEKQERKDTKTSAKTRTAEKTVRKAARKVNELAHANFHRLKLRQNGAKGGPGHNSRFRRKR